MSDLNPPLSVPASEYVPAETYFMRPRKPRYWLHILLLLATMFTTLVVGAHMEYNFQHNSPAFTVGDEFIPLFPLAWVLAEPSRFFLGVPFSAPLLVILLAHEMGHYVCCRYYRVDATLPFFIPDQIANPLADCSIRYWNLWTHRWIRGRSSHAGDCPGSFETCASWPRTIRSGTGIPFNLPRDALADDGGRTI
jgi:hypothetical protein